MQQGQEQQPNIIWRGEVDGPTRDLIEQLTADALQALEARSLAQEVRDVVVYGNHPDGYTSFVFRTLDPYIDRPSVIQGAPTILHHTLSKVGFDYLSQGKKVNLVRTDLGATPHPRFSQPILGSDPVLLAEVPVTSERHLRRG